MRDAGYQEEAEIRWDFKLHVDPNTPPTVIANRSPVFHRTDEEANSRYTIIIRSEEESTTLEISQQRLKPGTTWFVKFWKEIEAVCTPWLAPDGTCTQFKLAYHNCFSRETQPKFWNRTRPRMSWLLPWVEADKLGFRMTHAPSLSFPLVPLESFKGDLFVNLGVPQKSPNHLHLIFTAFAKQSRHPLNLTKQMGNAHNAILHAFEDYFPDEAKETFATMPRRPKKKSKPPKGTTKKRGTKKGGKK